MRSKTVIIALVMLASIVGLRSGTASSSYITAQMNPGQGGNQPIRQIIVKFAADQRDSVSDSADETAVLSDLGLVAGEELTYVRPMSGGAHVLAVGTARSPAEMAVVSDRLNELPEIEYAEPDLVKTIDIEGQMQIAAGDVMPNDARFGDQWHYGYTKGTAEGLNLPPAWAISTGVSRTVVAVIDTGILDHPDLAGKILPGYDMISNPTVARDGDGRDDDPSDPGDWNSSTDCPTRNSSWHGTHVAGTIGAASNNNLGVAGVNWQAKILPVRVLGRCGGTMSDIVDAVRWSAGIEVPGAPPNPNPADVINLSLGGYGVCGASEQEAFNDVVAAGVTVAVAAGNNFGNAADYSPGNCDNVITVAATDRSGDLAYYSNSGSVVEISAPGGETFGVISNGNGVLSTLNEGTTSPGEHSYAYYQGTSMATPHVAGLASLIVGQRPSFGQAHVLATMQASARPFPTSSGCSITICGAGIADAGAALALLPPVYPAAFLPLVTNMKQSSFVSFGASEFSAGEGDGEAKLIVKLNSAADSPVTVRYRTLDGTAVAGEDYVQKNETLIFNPGQASKIISITLLEDYALEEAETFFVELYSPQGALIESPSKATVTIWDDDEAELLPNGDFEQGRIDWVEYSSNNWPLIMSIGESFPVAPHSGQYGVWLGGGNYELGFIQQTITVSSQAPYLTYWHWINSADGSCGNDIAGVLVDGATADVYPLCTVENTLNWVRHTVDLSNWIGQTVVMRIQIETNGSDASSVYVDDVGMMATAAAPVTEGPAIIPPPAGGRPATNSVDESAKSAYADHPVPLDRSVK